MKVPRNTTKRIFWQTSTNEERTKLKVWVDNIYIQGLVDMEADVSIITPQSWHARWPLQEVDIQFLGIGTLLKVKQSSTWLECIGPEGQRGILKPYVAVIAINLW